MNLSSYLQMPPAPSVPSSPNSTPQGVRIGASPSVGGNLGFDFAQVMARQIQRLVPPERQTLAADAAQTPEIQARDSENTRRADDRQSTERSNQNAQADHSSRRRETADNTADDHNDQAASHTRPRAKAAPQKTTPIDEAALSNSVAPAMPVTPVQTGEVSTSEVDATASLAGTPLQTIELSPQVRIITDPQKAPSPESLAAFAKSMGLDESTIQNLLGQPAANAAAPTVTTAASDATPVLAMATGPMSAASVLPTTAGTLSAVNGDTLNALTQAASMPDGAVATQVAAATSTAMTSGVNVSGAGLALSASTLNAPIAPGLSPTDMAAIQQVQITVLPAVVLPMNVSHNTPTPSTLDMLSLLGSGVDEKDVSALLTQFTAEAGNQDQPSEQQSSNSESNNFSSFSQALTRNNTAAATNTHAAQAAAPNMSDVYDQLSDKMATELAARMHKQLSDGEWKMKFGLRPANLGGVEIHLEMKDGKLDAVFHADNPLTRDLLQNSSQRLREALGNFGINAGQVQVGQGGSNAQQNASGNSGKRPQVRDNSTSQVNGTEHASSVGATRNKANASLLDLYA
jgi:flagellar hook-length control protein FliK